ncbi:BRAP2 RING ZnF UBP domain-containing protein 2-like, partial [Zingiber officinale]|uniref:BRAP2 RING ZnF UBP domain-containing protein 2-like n=1 Tax=Zingiber officinale TaxID=94328 RepID=UPI001C4A9CA0
NHVDDKRGSCECSEDLGFDEALLNMKLDTMAGEYNDLLTSQLDNQRKYYESLVLEIKEETEKDISEAIKKAVSLKLQKFQIKLDKCIEEKKFMEDLHFASSFKWQKVKSLAPSAPATPDPRPSRGR